MLYFRCSCHTNFLISVIFFFFKDKQVGSLASIALFVLLGLLFIQFYWLNTVLEEKWSIISYEILKEIDDEYEERLEEQYDMDRIVEEKRHPKRGHFLENLDQIIHKKLRRQEGMQNYEYALTSLDSLRFQHFSNPKLKKKILEKGDRKKLGSGKHHYYLYLYIPNKNDLLYAGMQKFVLLFLLFSLFLIGVFAYTLINLSRQKQLSVMKNDFINNLTHEFKTPIATIDLATKTLQNLESVQNDQRATNYVSLIKEEGTRLENHVDKVLQMSLVDSGNFTLEMRTVDVHQKIGAVLQSLQLIMQENKGEFHLDFDAQDTEIQGDKILLFNLFYNLVDNAIKYSEDAPIITITTKDTAEGLLVSIQDNGIGMSENEQLLIFERFYRTNKNKVFQSSGFGLGLSYVKQVADAHGASVRLESELGKGTRFELVFAR